MGEMKCKLSCPLTLVKMLEYPVRFEKCKHVECFDAITYLKMNYKRPSQNSWKCPICQKHEPWETLKLCTWTKKVASETHSEINEIFLTEDEPLWKLNKNEENLLKDDKKVETGEIDNTLDSDDDNSQ